MPVMEISFIPIGTRSTSVSSFIAACERVLLDTPGISFQITAMGTLVQSASLKRLFAVAAAMHERLAAEGVRRIFSVIKIDDRRDKRVTIQGKVDAVLAKLPRGSGSRMSG